MNTYFDVYLPIANIIIESVHAGSKYPPQKVKGTNTIIRKRKSGEYQHNPDKTKNDGHRVRKYDSSGDLPGLVKTYPESKKAFVKYGYQENIYSLGKGSKSKRRIEKLKKKE